MTPAMQAAASARRRYAERKARGVCAHDGCSAPPLDGRVRCARHLAMVQAAKVRKDASGPSASATEASP